MLLGNKTREVCPIVPRRQICLRVLYPALHDRYTVRAFRDELAITIACQKLNFQERNLMGVIRSAQRPAVEDRHLEDH